MFDDENVAENTKGNANHNNRVYDDKNDERDYDDL